MSARALALTFCAALVVALVATLPLGLAIRWMGAGAHGLAADTVSGTVWRGELRNASLRGLPLGDLRLGLDPLGLVLGGGRVRFAVSGPLAGEGVADLRGARLGLSGVNLTAPAAALADDLPFAARLRLEEVAAQFDRGACRRAAGRVVLTDISLGRGTALPGLTLSGAAACRDGAWTAPLSGAAAGVDVEAELRIDSKGRYRLATLARTTDPTLGAAMALAGFERTLDGFRRTDQARLAADEVR